MEPDDSKAIHALVERHGWNPDRPNAECVAAITRPPLFSRLSPEDADGCHFLLTYMEYDRVLHRLEVNDDDGHGYALSVATYVVLKHNNAVPRTRPEFVEFAQGFQRWSDRVMVPATQRMRVAKVDEKRENDWLLLHREQFEPVITLTMVQNDRFFPADTTPDYLRLARGMAMHEEGVMHLKLNPAALDGQTFLGYFDMLTKPGHWLATYGADGLLRIDSAKTKTAMDAEFGRQKNRKHVELTPELADATRTEQMTPLKHAQAIDLALAIRALASEPGMKTRDQRAARAVGEHYPDLVTGELSIRKLAIKTGISRQALDNAWAVLRARVERSIG